MTDTAGSTAIRERRTWWPRDLWIWVVLALWLIAGGIAPNKIAGSWHFVVTGVDTLFGSTGGPWSSLYAAHPDVQMGPVTFLVGAPFVLAGGAGAGKSLATVLMTATGFVLFAAVVALARHRDGRDPRPGAVSPGAVSPGAVSPGTVSPGAVSPGAFTPGAVSPGAVSEVGRAAVLVGGLLFLAGWVEVGTRAGHLDDILALVFTVAALATRLRHHTLATALLLALAVDSKPWAIAFVPLLLDLTVSIRRNAAAIGLWVLVVAAAWAPFALADHATLNVSRFTIPTDASSGLRALGIAGAHTPGWDRPAQAVVGAALGVVAIVLRRPAAVPLLGLAVRVAIDPGVHPYYNSGLLLATVVVDLVLLRWGLPWLTIAAFALIEVAHYGLVSPDLVGSAGPHLAGLLRLATCAVLCLAALFAPVRGAARHPVPQRSAMEA